MVWIGTSGFSFKGWVGPVYPPGTKPHQMFPYYVQRLGFNCLELNYTFYQQPQARTMEALLRETGEDFRFTVKANNSLTHDLPVGVTPDGYRAACRRFLLGIEPLVQAGKLGCILAQFPGSFIPSRSSRHCLRSLSENLSELHLVVEFRNRSWAREEYFLFLEQSRLGICAIDEPQQGNLMPFLPRFTTRIAYFRLHGRNEKWFSHPQSRYDYVYSRQELEGLLPHFVQTRRLGLETYIMFNNCHAGAAAGNAAMLRELMNPSGLQLSLP